MKTFTGITFFWYMYVNDIVIMISSQVKKKEVKKATAQQLLGLPIDVEGRHGNQPQ